MAEPLADQNLADKPIAEKPFADKSLSDKPFQDIKLKETIVESHESESGGKLAAVAAEDCEPRVAYSTAVSAPRDDEKNWGKYQKRKTSSGSQAYGGNLRHRLVLASCLCFAAGILALSTANLKALVSTEGTIDQAGKITLNPEVPKLSPDLLLQSSLVEDLYQVKENTWTSHLVGFADRNGKLVIAPRFRSVHDFSDGLASFNGDKHDAKHGSVEQIVPDEDNTAQMRERARLAQLEGYIDKTGKVVIPAQFDEAGAFDQGVALVSKDENTLLINKAGKVLFSTANFPEYASLTQTERDSRTESNSHPFDFADKHLSASQERFNLLYGYAGKFFFGPVAIVSGKNTKVGLIDRTGKWRAYPIYDQIYPASMDNTRGFKHFYGSNTDELESRITPFIVKKNNLFGVLDSSGHVLIPPKFTRILSFHNGHAAVLVGDKCGFADSTGNIVIQPKYDFVTAFDKIIAVEQNKVWSFIDSSGRALNGPSVDRVLHSTNGVWVSDGMGAVLKDGKVGFLDSSGKFALKPQYDWAMAFVKGRAPVHSGTSWRYVDKSGTPVSRDFAAADSVTSERSPITVKGPLYDFIALGQINQNDKTIDEWKNLKKPSEKSSDDD